MVAGFFDSLDAMPSEDERYGPVINRLRGSIEARQDRSQVHEEDHSLYLEEQYG